MVRVEELYPWPEEELRAIFSRYTKLQRVVWAQEEPRNMGAWTFVQERLQGLIGDQVEFLYAGRSASASPATGSSRVHRAEQKTLLADAFQGIDGGAEIDPRDALGLP